MSDPIFPQGIRVWPPHANAPDFIKGALVINAPELGLWMSKQPNAEIRLDIKESKKGGWYLQLNTYKPKSEKPQGGGGNPAQEPAPFTDDIPFVTNAGIK
ncbi:MAG: hypothetical protein KGL39_13975 [Patescibacteria group bacterium]|nr:hypothetical protein [Patescibacteria group bacterium]